MRRALQLGQLRALHEKATSRSKPQSGQRIRAKPRPRMPQSRYARRSRSTWEGSPRPVALRSRADARNGSSRARTTRWSSNGDTECLALNPTGASSGTTNEGPKKVDCTQPQEFSRRF